MLSEPDKSDSPIAQHDSTDAQKALQEKLSRIANKAAKRAGNRQQRYNGEHGIFTK